MNERLKKQLSFILTIDKEKNILRQTHLTGHGRRENDAEHAWHMSIMAYLLKEYANEDVDIAKVMIMCLVHDLVEIYAGDTYAFDEKAKETQQQREQEAAQKLFAMLPKDQADELRGLFEEFEAYETPEAKFARCMDNLQPLLLNDSNQGNDWKEHGVNFAQVMARQSKSKLGSKTLGDYIEERVLDNVKKGAIKP